MKLNVIGGAFGNFRRRCDGDAVCRNLFQFCPVAPMRTRARTWDPLIKSQLKS
jgi:hypothetical protein